MPVPTSGASAITSGTAWRCMFEPISARLASSCSRNGIIAVATETIWRGGDVHVVDLDAGDVLDLAALASGPGRGPRRSVPSAFSGAFAWAMTCSSSSSAVR